MTLQRIMCLIAFAVAGGLVGWLYFRMLSRAVEQLIAQGRGPGSYLGSMLPRIGLVMCGIVAAVLTDPLCVIPYLLAFLVVRTVVVTRWKKQGALTPPMSGTEDE
jgi:F1-F0 ATPase (N-ATPase) AtpR subunit